MDNPTLICCDCGADYLWDESPSDERCAQCSAWHSWWFGGRDDSDAA